MAATVALLFSLAGCGQPADRSAAKPVIACAGVDDRLDPALKKFDEESVGAHLFRDPALIRVNRAMRQGRWMVAWSSPADIGPSVYVLRQNGPAWEMVGDGRVADARTRPQVAAWAMGLERHRPDPMPPTLAWCLADALLPAASAREPGGRAHGSTSI